MYSLPSRTDSLPHRNGSAYCDGDPGPDQGEGSRRASRSTRFGTAVAGVGGAVPVHGHSPKAQHESRSTFALVNGLVLGGLAGAFVGGSVSTLSDLVDLIRHLWDKEASLMADVERLRAELAAAEQALSEVTNAREQAEQARADAEQAGVAA